MVSLTTNFYSVFELIGRIFAYWVIVYLGSFLETKPVAQFWAVFSTVKVTCNFLTKIGLGYIFGDLRSYRMMDKTEAEA
jgi:hypothetical protein